MNRETGRDEFFREVTLRVSSSLEITEALECLLKYLSRFIPVDTIGLYRLDLPRKSIFAVAEVARGGDIKTLPDDYKIITIDPDLQSLIERNLSRESLISIHNDSRKLPASVLQCFPNLSSRSVIGLQLKIKQEYIGGLALSSEGFDRYTREHAELLEEVKEPIALAMSNACRFRDLERYRDRLAEDNRALANEMERAVGVEVVGADCGLSRVMGMVRRVAPMASPVLLQGETGTGKEVIANAIHLASPRSPAPMVRVQCGAIPETLLDSELFGHEKGAFTGAVERKRGRFERAAGGTIFLDEIGELTPEAQVKLLRVLQEKQFERVGGSETLSADIRVIAATHRNLAQRVREGRFREDLWYRLNVFPIHIPPLRMRREDILPLLYHFVERKAREMNLGFVPGVRSEDLPRLQAYDWPGNVRELQNVVERSLILSHGKLLSFPSLNPIKERETTQERRQAESPPPAPLDQAMAAHIRLALAAAGGKVAGRGGAAEQLGIHPSTLRSRMKKLGIRPSWSGWDSSPKPMTPDY